MAVSIDLKEPVSDIGDQGLPRNAEGVKKNGIASTKGLVDSQTERPETRGRRSVSSRHQGFPPAKTHATAQKLQLLRSR